MYIFGTKSWEELRRGHPKLIGVATLAITRTAVDFGAHDVARSLEEQQGNVDDGVSWTLDSMHRLRHPDTGALANDSDEDAVAWAMDLVPYIRGRMRWEWAPIYKVADAVRDAARDLKVDLIWGGVWDRPLLELGDLELEVEKYVARQRAAGRKARIDGPHFEMIK